MYSYDDSGSASIDDESVNVPLGAYSHGVSSVSSPSGSGTTAIRFMVPAMKGQLHTLTLHFYIASSPPLSTNNIDISINGLAHTTVDLASICGGDNYCEVHALAHAHVHMLDVMLSCAIG